MVVGNSLAGKGHSVPGDHDGHHDYGDGDHPVPLRVIQVEHLSGAEEKLW